MASFRDLLSETKRDCGWEHIPYDKISAPDAMERRQKLLPLASRMLIR